MRNATHSIDNTQELKIYPIAMKRPSVTELKNANDRQAYERWALKHWKSGQYKPLIKDFFMVFPLEITVVVAQRAGLDVQSPNKQTFVAFLREMFEWTIDWSGNFATVSILEIARSFIDAPAVVQASAAHKLPYDQQRATEALHAFLNNPNDNNHLRLSRLLSVYAASNRGFIKQDYVPASERNQSIRAFSGGRCSPR